eukprot:scaffold129766_cov13-Tisochrysis_lutea.AAC.1
MFIEPQSPSTPVTQLERFVIAVWLSKCYKSARVFQSLQRDPSSHHELYVQPFPAIMMVATNHLLKPQLDLEALRAA